MENRELRREEEFFRLAAAHFAKGQLAPNGFPLIDQLADQHSVAWLPRQLGVARSGFYSWWQRQEAAGKRVAENARLTAEIEAVSASTAASEGPAGPRGTTGCQQYGGPPPYCAPSATVSAQG